MAKSTTTMGGVNKNPMLRVKVPSRPLTASVVDVTPKKKRVAVAADDDAPPVKKNKKRVVVEDDAPPIKKKKRKVSTELAVSREDDDDDAPATKSKRGRELAVPDDEPDGPRISKLKVGKGQLHSIFGDDAEKVHQLLERNQSDDAVTLLYKRMIQTTVDMIPFAEHAIRKSKGARGVYQINSLMSQLRELLVDIQSSQDRGLMGQAMMANILVPSFKEMATAVVQEYSCIKADIKAAEMDPREYQRLIDLTNESRGRLANEINRIIRHTDSAVIAFLQR